MHDGTKAPGNMAFRDSEKKPSRVSFDIAAIFPGIPAAKYLRRYPGSFATSDEAVYDSDGQLWVLGRADDVINVAAHRISTIELEAAVAATSGVAEVAVVGVSDPLKGTVPIAFVSLQQDANEAMVKKEAANRAEAAMGPIARLHRVVVIPAFPKSRAGKIVRRLLRDLAETGAARGDISALEDLSALIDISKALAENSG